LRKHPDYDRTFDGMTNIKLLISL